MKRPGILLIGVLMLLAAVPVRAARFQIIVTDGIAEGMNDPTPVAPVGGNPGTTLGQQRLNVLLRAADRWAEVLPSNVTIRVRATFDPISPCDSTGCVLGQGGAIALVDSKSFSGGVPHTLYPVALANKLAGHDLDGGGDDITIQFNSEVDSRTGLGNTGWYYGFDGNEGSDIDMLPVALHELAHGLGFNVSVNLETGAFPDGVTPTLYSRYVLDTAANRHWSDMTNAERVASATNTGHLVWDGLEVTAGVPALLEHRRIITVNAPASVAGTYFAGIAPQIGPSIATPVVTAPVVLAEDGTVGGSGGTVHDACEPLANAGEVAGKIVLVDRGLCRFSAKAQNAQDAGAAGVIVVDNVANSTPPDMGGTASNITIPVASVTQAVGDLLQAEVGSGLNITVGGMHPTLLAGADGTGWLLLYAPRVLAGGSSISHWDNSARPDLLMEPSTSSELAPGELDITVQHFADLGWLAPPRVPRPIAIRSVPNPWNSATALQFRIDAPATVEMEVFDVQGTRVRHLVTEEPAAGLRSITWDGRDDDGRSSPGGVYYVRLKAGATTLSGRTVRLL